MALTIISPAIQSSAYFAGVSLPEMAGFAISDDGDGGTLDLNGQGVVDPTVTNAFDLKTIFTGAGLLFRSIPLLRAFRLLYRTPNDAAAEEQFQKHLDINMFPISATDGTTAGLPVINAEAGLSSGPANVPYLRFTRPSGEGASVAGVWRVELRLRHSVTN